MNMHYYLGYGMNSNPTAMILRTGNARAIGRAVVADHAFRFAYHADVYPQSGSRVDGVLWEIDDHALQALDEREGYPTYYTRKIVTAEADGQQYESWMYMMTPGHVLQSPDSGYLRMIVEGYQHFGVPLTQVIEAQWAASNGQITDTVTQV
jgi:gamma-glutamylcyclotransferase (GGCT)/AIG2-like uncharacterized protein YtfP